MPFRQELIDAANAKLRELKGQLDIDARHSSADGLVCEVVCREDAARKADLIVAGRARSQDKFGSLWSRRYSLVRGAPCPVLSV